MTRPQIPLINAIVTVRPAGDDLVALIVDHGGCAYDVFLTAGHAREMAADMLLIADIIEWPPP